MSLYEVLWEDGEPCKHRGCKNHVLHPCEGCGRTGAKGKVFRRPWHISAAQDKEA